MNGVVSHGNTAAKPRPAFGFVDVGISRWGVTILGCTAHESHNRRWVNLPGKPSLVDGVAARDEANKIRYFPTFQFDIDDLRRRFSDAVIAELVRSSRTPLASILRRRANDIHRLLYENSGAQLPADETDIRQRDWMRM